MHFQFEVAPSIAPQSAQPPHAPPSSPAETAELLRQLIELQREQVNLLRAANAVHDAGARWRAFLARWEGDFPQVAAGCRQALPALERAYISLIADLTDQLQQHGSDALDNDFALGEFLDRYGMRLGQLGTILSLVGPLAEAAGTQSESS
jgi:hypothetical protein